MNSKEKKKMVMESKESVEYTKRVIPYIDSDELFRRMADVEDVIQQVNVGINKLKDELTYKKCTLSTLKTVYQLLETEYKGR